MMKNNDISKVLTQKYKPFNVGNNINM